jgi:hypothetical protein
MTRRYETDQHFTLALYITCIWFGHVRLTIHDGHMRPSRPPNVETPDRGRTYVVLTYVTVFAAVVAAPSWNL